ncbi:hypothetical protein CPB83DRAFT_901074 [Crepidotus variabilis]|uniref:Fe2OG dioxygenase domain-containing protein n=1 Tax=Crepidotus variabilis TaxID=179855 RepID=A0A9P6JX24_9AGAR|nr:hypothetical protein CPB83DRAFT_901074 [Crepidotus variabilis]
MASGNENISEFMAKFSEYNDLPYCSGVVSLSEANASLFYTTDLSNAKVINFTEPTQEQISALAQACQPATFGVNQQDVLDESYRKAGKMDAENFATQFSPNDLGMIAIIKGHLFRERSEQPMRAELYKLNVYGPGAFFKSHVDTPRSDTMFGSLVIILPTVHEGGNLIFRHDDNEWNFESAKAVSMSPPQAAFAAFFSDVEHKVLPVTAGYRVTLTYNLYFEKATEIIVCPAPNVDESLRVSLSRVLKDPAFLPDGGALGFGLSYKYPFDPQSTSLSDVLGWLKGPDAAIKQVCEAVSLKVAAKAIYGGQEEEGTVLLDQFYNFTYSGEMEEGIVDCLLFHSKKGTAQKIYDPEDYNPSDLHVVWLKPLGRVNKFKESYIAYGNQASLDYTYGDVCLIATVPPANERASSSAE